jgi:hypothetical protein
MDIPSEYVILTKLLIKNLLSGITHGMYENEQDFGHPFWETIYQSVGTI